MLLNGLVITIWSINIIIKRLRIITLIGKYTIGIRGTFSRVYKKRLRNNIIIGRYWAYWYTFYRSKSCLDYF